MVIIACKGWSRLLSPFKYDITHWKWTIRLWIPCNRNFSPCLTIMFLGVSWFTTRACMNCCKTYMDSHGNNRQRSRINEISSTGEQDATNCNDTKTQGTTPATIRLIFSLFPYIKNLILRKKSVRFYNNVCLWYNYPLELTEIMLIRIIAQLLSQRSCFEIIDLRNRTCIHFLANNQWQKLCAFYFYVFYINISLLYIYTASKSINKL